MMREKFEKAVEAQLKALVTSLDVLKAIDAFWREGHAPLSPYAQITDEETSIHDLVKAAIVAAEPELHP